MCHGLRLFLRPAAAGTVLVLLSALSLVGPIAALGDPSGSPERVIARIEGTTALDNKLLLEAGYDIAAARPGEWTDLIVPAGAEKAGGLAALQELGYRISSTRLLEDRIDPQYHTYPEMLAALQQYAASYPTIARIEDIGDGWGKIYSDPDYVPHEIWALKISDNVAVDEAEPAILYSGVHHAREPVTVEICLGIADYLLTRYGSDPTVRRWIDDHETWIVPIVNPDGHWCVTDLNHTDWRKNVRDNDGDGEPTPPGWWWAPDGVDNNRNYAWQWGGEGSSGDPNDETYRGPAPFSEPENQAMRDLAMRENFSFSIDYHSYGELVLYPYGFDEYTLAPDDVILSDIAWAIRDRIGGNYVAQQANQLYPAAGNSQDWHYGQYNGFGYIIETATSFIPGGAQIAGIVTANIRGALYVQERVDGPGVRGIVRINGMPGEATVTLVGVDDPELNNPRKSHAVTGDYYRLVDPGAWTLRFSADGFADQEFDVEVPSNTYLTLNVDFGVPQDAADFGPGAGPRLDVYPNPARAIARLRYALPGGLEAGSLDVHDLTGRLVWRQPLSGSAGTVTWNARTRDGHRQPAGVYLARLSSAEGLIERRIVLVP